MKPSLDPTKPKFLYKITALDSSGQWATLHVFTQAPFIGDSVIPL